MPKHILCIHPCGANQMVGDEKIVSNAEWETLKALRVGPYEVWKMKRDMGEDPTDVEDMPESDPTHEAVIRAEQGENPDVDARRGATKRAIKAGERQAPTHADAAPIGDPVVAPAE